MLAYQMPPELAVVPLKRLWAGDITVERIEAVLTASKPEIILLPNNSEPVSIQSLIDSDYSLSYIDNQHRLYVRKDIIKRGRG